MKTTSVEDIHLRPQPGPQEHFLSSSADIAIYGGSAGGGKTYALMMEPLYHKDVPGFGAVIFRKSYKEITNQGGMWDEAAKLYAPQRAVPNRTDLYWQFPSGVKVKFAHLQHEGEVFAWHGAQVPLICFDELTSFSEHAFFYLLSRNRSVCGVKPYMRATCNPDAESWVACFLEWWIDPQTGYPIPERAGVWRWFVRVGDRLVWADRKEDLEGRGLPKSVTFIPASVYDNRILMAADPNYLANLLALPTVERERLLGGNWKVKPAAGKIFNRGWFETVPDEF
jgi:hypothetical protein